MTRSGAPAGAGPSISVVIRSYNRVGALCDLLDVVLRQRGPLHEVVVVEQSASMTDEERQRLRSFGQDPRVRILEFGRPLGGARARNEGVLAASGDVVLLVDDDDLPVGDGWVMAHARHYRDPNCLGVSGRHVREVGERVPYRWPERAYRRCLMFSPWLRLPWTYVRLDRPKRPVAELHGTNASLRRSAMDRFGGWDEDTTIEDEASFCYRLQRLKRPEEFLCFDPEPVVVRRQDLRGGLNKRFLTARDYFGRLLDFVHRIVARYHRRRVFLLYPLYVGAAYAWTADWVLNDSLRYRTRWRQVAALVALLFQCPILVGQALVRARHRSPGRVFSSAVEGT